MDTGVLLYYKARKQVWVAMCKGNQVLLSADTLRKWDGESMRPFGAAEPRAKPTQKAPVVLDRSGDDIVAWALAPAS